MIIVSLSRKTVLFDFSHIIQKQADRYLNNLYGCLFYNPVMYKDVKSSGRLI